MDVRTEVVKLLANDGGDYYGYSVAISGDGNTAIVGVPYGDNEKGIDAGSAYVYTRSDGVWSEQSNLVASDDATGDWFGRSVAISGDGNTAIVGANSDDNNRGSAYIYTRTNGTWSEQSKLVASDGAALDWFGRSVSISSDGNTAIVGAYGDDNERGINAGSAYVYTRSGDAWSEQCKLVASDGATNDWFGYSVAISGDGNTAIISAYLDDNERGTGAGSAYIFTRSGDTWSEQDKLLASDGAVYDLFGISVSISSDGNTVIVGAHADDGRRGSAYIFTRSGSTWSEQAKLLASDGASYDYFGVSVAISSDGNTAIVGAYGDDNENGFNAGSAYIFDLT